MKKMKKKQPIKKFIDKHQKKIIIGAFCLIIIGVVTLINGYGNIKEYDEPELQINLSNTESGAIKEIRRLFQPDRDSYGKTAEGIKITHLIEEKLLPLPDDFWRIKYRFMRFKTSKELCNIESKYYQQPEWIDQPSKFIDTQLPYYQEGITTKSIWYREGVGGYPSIHKINTHPGVEFELCTFVFTGWRVETFQGINLIPKNTNKIIWNADKYNEMEFSENFDDIKVIVEEPIFLLEPIYPYIYPGWIKKVKLKIKISENATGTYAIKLIGGDLPKEYSETWREQHSELYSERGLVKSSTPIFQAIIEV